MKKYVISRKDLKNNLKIIRKKLCDNGKDDFGNYPKLIAVVKGNGMGLGLVEYSKFLVNQGIDCLAVANLEEALILRQADISEEILMLTPFNNQKELEKLIENNITLTITSVEQIEIVENILNKLEKQIKVHIKIDTGFARYGFLYNDLQNLLQAFKMCDKIQICGTYTHFSRPLDDKFTKKQFNRFMDCIEFLKKEGQTPGLLHVSESTAFLKYPIMRLNAVRIGSLIQGRTLIEVAGLKKIGQFKTEVKEIKQLPKGYNISYGDMYKTKRETKIAVIPVGYMDGFNVRKDRDIFSLKENILSIGIEIKKMFKDNSLKVSINNKTYKIIGRIGMYHSIVDITDEPNVNIGDEVTINIPPMQTNSIIRREYV